jgi:hypothetical protein
MRRLVIAMLTTALSGAATVTAAQASGTIGLRTPVTVTPARGTPATTFTVRFKTPFATGTSHGLRNWEIASVVDNRQSSASCTSSTAARLRPAAVRHRVSVTLSTAAKPWCTGAYTGKITLYRAVVCGPGPIRRDMACPEIAFAPQPIGRFQFTVSGAA